MKYEDLVELCKLSGTFYNKVEVVDDYELHSFNYAIASYTDFTLMDNLGLEARGATFLNNNGKMELIARPFHKFFNYKENPFTAEEIIKDLEPVNITKKIDGSLIMVFTLPNGKVYARTQNTCFSEQATRATGIIRNNVQLKDFCENYVRLGFTPLFEYTAPTNQIVCFYEEEKLSLIGLRNINEGYYKNLNDIKNYQFLNIVESYDCTLEEIISLQEKTKNEEGWVIDFSNGLKAKFKTLDYCKKHRLKDSVSSKKALADVILNGGLDDILPLIANDKDQLEYVNNFKESILSLLVKLETKITEFYSSNKDLERKDFAIKATKELGGEMGLAMSLYIGKKPNFVEYFIKNKMYDYEI